MSLSLLGLLFGLFIVPGWLLREGRGLRKRSRNRQRLFWGVIFGHTSGILIVSAVLISPAEAWSVDDRLRSALIYWSLVAGSLGGGALGFLFRRRT